MAGENLKIRLKYKFIINIFRKISNREFNHRFKNIISIFLEKWLIINMFCIIITSWIRSSQQRFLEKYLIKPLTGFLSIIVL